MTGKSLCFCLYRHRKKWSLELELLTKTISCGRASNAEKSEKMINRLPENFEFSRGLFVPGDILPHNRTRDG